MAFDEQTDDPLVGTFGAGASGPAPALPSVTQRVSTPAPQEEKDPLVGHFGTAENSGYTPYIPAPTWHAADIPHGLAVGWHSGVAAPLAEVTGQTEEARSERESAAAAQQAMTPGAEQTWPVWMAEQAAPTAAMVGPSVVLGGLPLLGVAGAGAVAASAAGIGAGALIGGGSAISGNKAAIESADDETLKANNPDYAADRTSGLTEQQAKAKLGASMALSVGAPSAVLGAVMGGAGGAELTGLLKLGVGGAETAALTGGNILTRRVSGRIAQGVVGAGRGLAEQGLPGAAQELVSKHAEAQEGLGPEATSEEILAAGVGQGLFGAGMAGLAGAWHGHPVTGKTAPPKAGEASHTGSEIEYRTPAGKVTAPTDLQTLPENRAPVDPTPANKGVGAAETAAITGEPLTQGVTEPPKPPVEQPPVVQPPPPPVSRPPEAPPAADTTRPPPPPQPEARPQPAPAPAPATENVAAIQREPDAALAEQHAALIDKANPREAMVYPLGVEPFDLPNKRSFGQTVLGNGDGRVIQFQKYGKSKFTNADKVNFIHERGGLNDILGLGPVSKDEALARTSAEEPGAVVTERTAGGTPVKDAAGTTATVPEQAAALEATKTPGSTIEVRSPEAALAERQAQIQAEAAAPKGFGKMMLTQADKRALRELGHSDEAISHMTPDQGADIISRGERAEVAQPQVASVTQEGKPDRRLDGATKLDENKFGNALYRMADQSHTIVKPDGSMYAVPDGQARAMFPKVFGETPRVLKATDAASVEADRASALRHYEIEQARRNKQLEDEKADTEKRQHKAKEDQAIIAGHNIAADKITATHAHEGSYADAKAVMARARKIVAAAKGIDVPKVFQEGHPYHPSMLKIREAMDLIRPEKDAEGHIVPQSERLARFIDREHMIDTNRAAEAYEARRNEGALGHGSPEGAVEVGVKKKGALLDADEAAEHTGEHVVPSEAGEGHVMAEAGAVHEEGETELPSGYVHEGEEHAEDEPFVPSETNPIAQKMREDWLAKSPEERAAISRQRNVDDLKDALKRQELVQRGKYTDREKAVAKEKADDLKAKLAAKDVPQSEIQAVVDAVHKPTTASIGRRKLDVERPKVNVGEKLKLKAREPEPAVQGRAREDEDLYAHLRDAPAEEPGKTVTVGKNKVTSLREMNVKTLMRENFNPKNWGKGSPADRNLQRALERITEDVPVHIISQKDMDLIAEGAEGVYHPSSNTIFLTADGFSHDTAVHEVFHAATTWAIHNSDHLTDLVERLRVETLKNLPPMDDGMRNILDYYLKDRYEFLTGMITHPLMQSVLKGVKISDQLARDLGVPLWRKRTMWEGAMSIMRQALKLEPRDTSAIEGAMALSEHIFEKQDVGLAMEASARQGINEARELGIQARPREPPEVQAKTMGEDAEDAVKKPSSFWDNDRVQATKSGIGEKFTNAYLKGAMTDVLRIDNEHLFGPKGEKNALLRAQEGQLKQGHMIENMLKGHTDLLQRTMDMKRLNPDGLERVFSLLSEAHDFGIHPDVELGAGLNDYIKPNPKTGEYDETTNRDHFEAIHAHSRLSDDFNHSTPEEQRLFKDVRDVLMDEGAKSVKANIETFTQRVKTNFERDEKLQDALKTPEANRTPADIKRVERYEAVTKALDGEKLDDTKTEDGAETEKEKYGDDPHIKGIRDLRGMLKQEGPHFPGTRKGGWVVNAEHEIPEAPNALSTKDNTVTFGSEKEAFDYQKELVSKSLPSDIETVREPVSSDQKPGERDTTYKVVVQNKHSSTAGSIHEGRTLGDKLRAIPGIKKESVTEPMLREHNDSIDYGIHSGTMRAMEHAVDALTHLSKEEKQAAKEAIEQGSLGLMKGNRMNRGLLKSNRVRGANADPVLALHDYLANSARSQARSKTQPDIDEAFREMREHSRATQDENTPKRGMIIQEMENRAQAFGKDGFTGQMPPWLQKFTTLAYLKDMMAPVHYALDLTHQYLYSIPHIAGRHGFANAHAISLKTMSDMGAGGVLGKGVKGVFSALKGSDHRPTDLMTYIRNNLAKNGATADELRAFDAGRETPHLGSIITDFSKSFDRTGSLSRANYYLQGIGNEMSHAVDAVNRVNTYMTAYRAERMKMGKAETPEANVAHHAQAVRYAKDTVSQTQPLYSASNRASFMRDPKVRAMMQFRSLPMAIYRLLAKNAYLAVKGETREVKQAAVISLVSTMGSVAALAGVGAGVPEPIRLAVEMGHALGLTGSWQDYQDQARRYTDAHMGKFGSRLIMDGVLGAAGIDARNRIGLQDLMVKDQMLHGSVKEGLFELAMGAPGGYLAEGLTGAQQMLAGDYKRAIPNLMPIRLFSDVAKAFIENQGGKQAGHGQPDMKPLDPFETFIKAAGGMPTREALYNQEGQLMKEASGEKKAAVQKAAGGNRAAIRAWNTAHPRDLITQAQVLRAKQTKKIETPKQKQVEKDYAVYQ